MIIIGSPSLMTVCRLSGSNCYSVTAQENPAYRYLFYEWLPEQSQWLASHPSDVAATARFVSVYHLIVEGAMFLTGMRYQLEGARRWGRTWGFYQGFTAATRDESRHVIFGVRYLRDLARDNPSRFVPLIQDTVREFRPLISTIMQPPQGDLTYFGGKHLEVRLARLHSPALARRDDRVRTQRSRAAAACGMN